MKKQKLIVTILTCILLTTSIVGCSKTNNKKDGATPSNSETTETTNTDKEGEEQDKDLSASLTFAIWDNNLNDFIEQNDMVGKFQEKYPNIDIEVEKIKDDSEYWNTMKIRASANQLPDVMLSLIHISEPTRH